MLSEVFIRFSKIIEMEEVEQLIKGSKKTVIEKIKRYSYIEDNEVEVIGILIINECGLIKCECEEDGCYCGFAIIGDLNNQICIDRFEKHIVSIIDRISIVDRIRPM